MTCAPASAQDAANTGAVSAPTQLPPPGAASSTDQGSNAQPVEGYNNTPPSSYTGAESSDTANEVHGHRGDKFSKNEIVQAATGFFGDTSEAVAKAVQKVFSENGLPNAYIKGAEGSGAFIVGLRYGSGWLMRKGYPPVKVYWQGPSVGFDFGANASKTFMLVYNLHNRDQLYQRFPGVSGSFYFVAGIGVNYLRSGHITIAPMRTGVGLRAGVNAGYLTFTRHETINPF
ncbi:MAG: DUF1134 domain-containing protein [Alphaproteobacteria bacterium]|nr:DUF1134 domain-containing protein [Alphaproteobacteria bacterium]